MIGHRGSGPFRIVDLGVFGVAAKVDVGKQTPVFKWLKLLEEGFPYPFGGIDKGLSIDCHRIGQNDAEVERRVAAPVGPYVPADAHHFRAEGPDKLIHGFLDFGLIDIAGWNVHETTIAQRNEMAGRRPRLGLGDFFLLELVALLLQDGFAAELDFVALKRQDLDQDLVAFVELIADLLDAALRDFGDV